MKELKVLITGVGITGKSSFRRSLKELIGGKKAIDIDGDYGKMPEEFDNQTIYIIEDVHATLDTACLPLQEYDLIIYLLPHFYDHSIFWLKRVWRWFENGYGSWDKHRKSWLGSHKPYDIKNIPLFFKLMFRDLQNRRNWIKQDMTVLSPFLSKTKIIRSFWWKTINFYPSPKYVKAVWL